MPRSSSSIVSLAWLFAAVALGACSDASEGPANSCESDLDCSRRDQCVDRMCVPIAPDDVVDGDVAADDVSVVDTSDPDVPADVDDDVAPDGSADVAESDGDATSDDVADTEVVDLCEGLCDADELCDAGRCFCTPGRTRLCGIKVGLCRQGQSVCRNGQWDQCEGDVKPSPEICDGYDNNCNGLTDELACAPPVVSCSAAASAPFGEIVEVSAEGSDPDGGDVTWAWTVLDGPDGGGASEVLGTEATLAFDAPLAGTWRLKACVTDNEGVEACCETSVTVIPPCVVPSAPGLNACGISWDRRPIIQFDALPAGVRYELSIGDAPWAEVSLAGQNYYRPPEALPGGGPAPAGAPVTIVGRACTGPGDGCCSESEEVTVALVEACDTPIAPTTENVIFSEYLINGKDAVGAQGPNFEAGEAIELTNLSNCPVSLDGHHLRYCNNSGCTSAKRFQDFGPADVIPPRGVFVTIRAPAASTCGFSFMPSFEDDGIFGIHSSTLELNVDGTVSNNSGWFNNNGGALRFATGAYNGPFSGTTILEIDSYNGTTLDCQSVGFDALGACGDLESGVYPTQKLFPNQLGRLWHPCDAVVDAYPEGCF